MRKILLLTLTAAFVMTASLAFAQLGYVGMFSDAGGTMCTMVNPTVGQVYFYHKGMVQGQTLSQFRVSEVGGASALPLGGFGPAPGTLHLGAVNTGLSVAYGACRTGNFYFGSQFYQFISAPACSGLRLGPDPAVASGLIESRDCSPAANRLFPANNEGITFNPNTSCPVDPACAPVIPVAEKTWGQIKALYR